MLVRRAVLPFSSDLSALTLLRIWDIAFANEQSVCTSPVVPMSQLRFLAFRLPCSFLSFCRDDRPNELHKTAVGFLHFTFPRLHVKKNTTT